jgi:hypothetical protein
MSYKRGFEKVPYPLGTEEWKSFLNYAKTYYKEVIRFIIKLLNEMENEGYTLEVKNEQTAIELGNRLFQTLLNATISPLVYVWENWQLLTSEAKLPYATPEYKTQLETQIKQVQEIVKKMGPIGSVQTETEAEK